MWNAKEQLIRLTRSLRSARTVELPKDKNEAANYLTSVVIANQHRSLSELLESSDFDVNFGFGRSQRNLLQIAANVGCFECLAILLGKGCNPNYQDISGCTALHLAARNGHHKCVLKLLEYKADVNIKNSEGFAMVHWLAVNGRSEILADVLSHLKDIDIEDSQGQTALHIASQNGHKATAQYLLSAGSDVNHVNSSGFTPLYFACSHGQLCIIELLLSQGALHKADNKGNAPIDLCLKGGYEKPLKLLLDAFPRLHNSLVPTAVKYLDKRLDKVLSCFSYLCLKSNAGSENILTSITEYVANAGFQLLCVTSDYMIQVQLFRMSLKLLMKLCYSIQNQSANSSPSINTLRMQNVPSTSEITAALLPLEYLWDSLKEWMKVIHDEITSKGLENGNIVLSSDENIATYQKRRSLQMLLMTSDRLCAIIQGYYDYLSNGSNVLSPKFEEFITEHFNVIKFLIERDPKTIFNHFSFILNLPDVMSKFLKVIQKQPIEERVEWFYKNLHKNRLDPTRNLMNQDPRLADPIQVRRQFVFEDSCKAMESTPAEDLKFHVGVQFVEEEGMGVGVLREWLDILSNEIFNPEYALFIHSPDGTSFQPNSNSAINPDHLNYFTFAGRIFGLALYHKQLVNVYFTRSFYKHVLGIPVCYTDVAFIDQEYAKNLQWILDNDVTDLGLMLTFSVETDVFGMMQEIELIPNGAQVPVTQENKAEYVQLVTELRMTRAIQPQIDAFRKGFQSFIPENLVKMFNEEELELLLSGSSCIDIDDWRQNTQYASGYQCSDQVILWFWKCVSEMSEEMKSKLVQFCTGSSRVPYRGFAHLHGARFVVTRTAGSDSDLPTASTCVNMLKLPEYSTSEILKEKLLLAVSCGSQGYGRA